MDKSVRANRAIVLLVASHARGVLDFVYYLDGMRGKPWIGRFLQNLTYKIVHSYIAKRLESVFARFHVFRPSHDSHELMCCVQLIWSDPLALFGLLFAYARCRKGTTLNALVTTSAST